MAESEPPPAERLYRKAELSTLRYTTTADLAPTNRLTGQDRTRGALHPGTPVLLVGPEAEG